MGMCLDLHVTWEVDCEGSKKPFKSAESLFLAFGVGNSSPKSIFKACGAQSFDHRHMSHADLTESQVSLFVSNSLEYKTIKNFLTTKQKQLWSNYEQKNHMHIIEKEVGLAHISSGDFLPTYDCIPHRFLILWPRRTTLISRMSYVCEH